MNQLTKELKRMDSFLSDGTKKKTILLCQHCFTGGVQSMQYNRAKKQLRKYYGCKCATRGKGLDKTCPATTHILTFIKYEGKTKVSYTQKVTTDQPLVPEAKENLDILSNPEKHQHLNQTPKPKVNGYQRFQEMGKKLKTSANPADELQRKIQQAEMWMRMHEGRMTPEAQEEALNRHQKLVDQLEKITNQQKLFNA